MGYDATGDGAREGGVARSGVADAVFYPPLCYPLRTALTRAGPRTAYLMFHTYVLAPFIVAFLGFILRFYGLEGAGSKSNPSFLLALTTVVTAMAFLALGVTDLLPPYGSLAFGVVGVGLAVLSVARWFMI